MKTIYIFLIIAFMLNITSCKIKIGGENIDQVYKDKNIVKLVEAATVGNKDEIQKLAANNVDVNAYGSNGLTPLFWALHAKNIQGVNALLKAGADPNLKAKSVNLTPMTLVSGGNEPELLALILKYGGNPNGNKDTAFQDMPLTLAASQGRLINVEMLMKAGGNINAHDRYGDSIVTNAAAMAQFEVVHRLLELGYNYNLSELAKRVNGIEVIPDSKADKWKARVLELLSKENNL